MKRQKKYMVFDLDDTLAHLKEPLCDSLNRVTGKNIHWKEWNSFNIIGQYEMEDDHFFDCIINNNILENMVPHEETREVLEHLEANECGIIVITSRAYHPDAYNVTKAWFDKYNLPHDAIHVTGHGMEKSDYIQTYDNIIAAVDDRPENCDSFIKSGKVKHTFLYDMPWNVNHNIPRISNLREVLKYI